MTWVEKLGLTALLLSVWVLVMSFLGPESSALASFSILLFMGGGLAFNLGHKNL